LYYGKPVRSLIKESDRKTFGITITPDMEVIFRVPKGTSLDRIKEYAVRRKAWILRQLGFFEQYHPKRTKRLYVSGETYLYLGKEYRLKIIEDNNEDVELNGEYICLYTPRVNNHAAVGHIIRKWYRERAEEIFTKRHLELQNEFSSILGYWIDFQGVRNLRSKWGEYNHTSGSYTLNVDLVMAPVRSIDYVIMHEIVHHKHINHDKNFFSILEKVMPDWRKWKENMEKMLA